MAAPKLPLDAKALDAMSVAELEALQQDLGGLIEGVRHERHKVVVALELKRAVAKKKGA
jgi:hypothetical protein